MRCELKQQQGFTILETLLYIAFFTFLMSSVLSITYQIINSSHNVYGKVQILQEGNFIHQKLDWAMQGASSVMVMANGTSLVIQKFEHNNPITITFTCSGGALSIKRFESGILTGPDLLNSENIHISQGASLYFTYIPQVGNTPVGIHAEFYLNNQTYSNQTFEFIKFLYKL